MTTDESIMNRSSLESELKGLGEENSDLISLFLYFGLQGLLFATLLVSDYRQLKWEPMTVYVTGVTVTFLVMGGGGATSDWLS